MKVRDDKLEFQVGSSEQKKVLSLIKTPFTRFWPIKVSIRSLPMLLNLQLCFNVRNSLISKLERLKRPNYRQMNSMTNDVA